MVWGVVRAEALPGARQYEWSWPKVAAWQSGNRLVRSRRVLSACGPSDLFLLGCLQPRMADNRPALMRPKFVEKRKKCRIQTRTRRGLFASCPDHFPFRHCELEATKASVPRSLRFILSV